MQTIDRHRGVWLALGAILLALAHFRFGLGVLAWVAPLPWMRFLRLSERPRDRAIAIGLMVLAWVLATAKIVTEPLPWSGAFAFGAPIGVVVSLPYLLWAWLRPRVSTLHASLAFAGTMAIAEWSLHAILPFGTWGSAANTQLEHLGLMQLASITGVHGVSFLMYFTAASAEAWLADRKHARQALAAIAAVVIVIAAGEARLVIQSASGMPTVRVAAVDTDATFGGPPLPSAAEVERIDAALEARTREAAIAGARLVVWPEAATLVQHGEERAFLDHNAALARELHVRLVTGYIVPLSLEPLRYENKFAMFAPDGALQEVYMKHHPVPGEPSVPGTETLRAHDDATLGRVAGAICYDYDYPEIGLGHARLGIDVAAIPSSDWRGIDPIHSYMASVRAIEGGHSMVRATRLGSSMIVDGYGRVRAVHSSFDGNARTTIADVPARGTPTIYTTIGDALIYASALYLVALFAALAWRARARRVQLNHQS